MAPTRVILMSCGSYNPPTNMHLRMFEIARDHLHRMGTHIVVGGVISPVHDVYAKKELASATHRCAMLRLALQNSDWIRLSTWETRQNCWTKTRLSLQHHQNLLNSILSNSNDIKHHLQMEDTEWIPENVKNSTDNTPIQIKLLCGADLLESFGVHGLWLEEDIDTIVGEHGLVVITREGSNPNKFIYDSDILSKHMHNICIVTEWIPNEVSSTRIRRALKRSESVRYLLQDSVIDYIYKHEIYDARASDTTIKLELPSPISNNYLHIDPRYLNAFLTPSPSDVIMDSPSPVEIGAPIDVPDTVVLLKNIQNAGGVGLDEAREQFINSVIGGNADNGNVKHVARAAYPGLAKQVIASETGVLRIVDEVGSHDEPTAKLESDSLSEEGHTKLTVDGDARNKTKIEQREVSDSRFEIIDAEIAEIDLGLRNDYEVIVKIQPGSLSSSELGLKENCGSTVGGAKSKVEQREALDSKTKSEITDIDLGLPDDGRIIVKLQPGSSSELAPKQARKSSAESLTKGKTDAGQREMSDLRSTKTEIVDVDLSLSDGHEIMSIQSRHSSSGELRLGECCWPTRESAANDKIEVCDRKITSQTIEVIDVQLGLDQKSTSREKRRSVGEMSSDQTSLSKAASETFSPGLSVKSIGKEKIHKEISIKREVVNIELDADGVVKIQPAHSSRSTVALNEDWKSRSRDNFEPIKIDNNDTEQAKLTSEITAKDNVEIGNTEASSRKETVSFELDRVRHLEGKTATLSPPLDGRHECALSDFGVDKEDYRLAQYGLDENEKEEEKPVYTVRSKLSKHADERDDTLDDVDDFVNDSEEIDSKTSDVEVYKSQVLVSAMIHKSHEEESECFIADEIDNGAEFSEGVDRSKFIVERLPLEPDADSEIDAGSGRRTKKGELAAFDQRSSWTGTCESSLEIDGRYLKSIVNTRKSPRRVREDQSCDVEIKKQHRIADDQQSEVFQSSLMTIKSPERMKREEICDTDADTERKVQTANEPETSRTEKVFQGTSRSTSLKVKGSRRVKELQVDEREFKDQDSSTVRAEKVFQSSSTPTSRSTSLKTRSSRKVEELQTGESEREFKNQDKSVSDQEMFRSEKASHRSSRTSTSAKSPKRVKKSQILYRSEMKDYDQSINDRVISQLEEVFQDNSKKFTAKTASPKKGPENVEPKKQSRETSRSLDEPSQHISRTSSIKSPMKIQDHKTVRLNDERAQEATRATKSADNKTTKCDFNEIKDVYTRKVRRYNVPLQGSLDSMIVSEESSAQKPKKDDAFSKKSKSYESIKRIQEVYLGVPSSKANSSASQLDMPDEFCSICCYMNDLTFRTEEEVSSPNQETFYTLRSACSSLADDDDSIECDICSTLNLQESVDDLENKVEEIPCELCRICGEVDGSYDQDPALSADRYGFKIVEPRRDDDDRFEIENCGFPSGTESADDRSKVAGKEKTKDPGKPKSQSLFIHGSSMNKDKPRELYFIPKDEIAILTCGARRVSRKGSLFRKKEDFNKARDNRRYSSVDSLQLAKMSLKAGDKALKITKNTALIGSADNLQVTDDSAKSLQRSADDVGCLNLSSDNLDSPANIPGKGNEEGAEESSQKTNARDKEEVKMILTQHGIKIISEKETAL